MAEPMTAKPAPVAQAERFSQKILTFASTPKHRGAFFSEDATARDMALVTAKHKDIKIYWMVDPQTHTIYDAKFFAYGGTASVAIAEVLSSLVKGLHIDTAAGITIEQIEALLRDEPELPAVKTDADAAFEALPILLETARKAYPEAKAVALLAIQLKEKEGAIRAESMESLTDREKSWLSLPKEEQLKRIDEVITRDIRPGLNFDGGDLTIVDLLDGEKLQIQWQGACGGCGSSTGATLFYIEDKLRREIYSGMQIIAN